MTNGNGILIVEDEPDLREALSRLIQHRGHAVQTAANGKEALAKLEQMGRPCLIILDLMMPEMNGWELREALLQRPEFADVPVLLVSGATDVAQAAEALQAAEYLAKPIDFARMFEIIDSYC